MKSAIDKIENIPKLISAYQSIRFIAIKSLQLIKNEVLKYINKMFFVLYSSQHNHSLTQLYINIRYNTIFVLYFRIFYNTVMILVPFQNQTKYHHVDLFLFQNKVKLCLVVSRIILRYILKELEIHKYMTQYNRVPFYASI